jgi:hypothetical protein
MALEAMWREEECRAFGGVRRVAGPGAGRPFRSPRRVAVAARAALVVVAVTAMGIAVVATGTLVEGTTALPSWSPGAEPESPLERLRPILLGAVVATGVVFVVWFVRAYRNLAALGVEGLRHRPGWAGVAWLVPLVNLVVPKELVDDLWRASDPGPAAPSAEWRHRPVPTRVHLWWASVLSSGVLVGVAQWVLASGVVSPRVGAMVVVVAHGVVAAAALVSCGLVAEVTRRQLARAAVLRPVRRVRRTGSDRPGLAPVYVLERAAVTGPVLVHARGPRVVGKY